MAGPFLIGTRVQLRPFDATDAPTLAEWINDPDLRNHILLRFPQSISDEKAWIESNSGRGTPRDLAFGVELRRGRRLIGSIGLHGIDWVHRRAVTGIFLYPPSLRGKGYGTEAKNLLLDYAFAELGLHQVAAIAFAGNAASIRALEKQGYTRSGVHRKAYLVHGQWVDGIYFDLLHEEWEKLPRRQMGKVVHQRRGPGSAP